MSRPLPKLRFPGQRDDEEIKILIRKHWIIDVKVGFVFATLVLVPLVLALFFQAWLWERGLTEVFWLTSLGLMLFLLYMLMITYVNWLNEELDVIIVTNKRVISHDQIDLFRRHISEANIGQVQDVKGAEHGLLSHLLGYGSLEIQTSARQIFFRIKNVSNCQEVSRQVMLIRDAFVNSKHA